MLFLGQLWIGIFSVYSNKDQILGIDFRGGEELIASFDQQLILRIDDHRSKGEQLGEVQHVYRSEIGSGEECTALFYKLKMESRECSRCT